MHMIFSSVGQQSFHLPNVDSTDAQQQRLAGGGHSAAGAHQGARLPLGHQYSARWPSSHSSSGEINITVQHQEFRLVE